MRPIHRREFVRVAGGGCLVGLAGCTDDGGGESNGSNETDGTNDLSAPVPEEYETATSIGGIERNPDQLSSKSGTQYQSEAQDGQRCDDCTYYIPDKNGDGLGACAEVEGDIEPGGWCTLYQPHQDG